MPVCYILFNKKAGGPEDHHNIEMIKLVIKDEIKYIDVEKIKSYKSFLLGLRADDYIILCGGGMMPPPDQDREDDELSTMIFYGTSKIKTLIIFPSLFKGAHTRYKKNIAILKGKRIKVEFDRPTALQIDGETILGVSSYTAQRWARKVGKSNERSGRHS